MFWFIAFHLWRSLNPCLETETIYSQGAHIHVDIYDCQITEDKPTIVLLHGGGASLDSYYKQIPALTKVGRVVAIDNRGHGRSTDDPSRPLSHELMAQDVKNVVDELGIRKPSLVGWSEGAIIAQTYARNFPNDIEKIVLIASIYHIDGYKASAVERLKNATADNWEPDAKALYEVVAPDPSYWPKIFEKERSMWLKLPIDSLEDIRKIKVPTFVLAADHDEYIKLSHIKKLASALPDGRLKVYKNADHMLPVNRSKEVNHDIMQFLK